MAVAAPETRPICLCTRSDGGATGFSGVAQGGCNLQQWTMLINSRSGTRAVTMGNPWGRRSSRKESLVLPSNQDNCPKHHSSSDVWPRPRPAQHNSAHCTCIV